MTLIELILVMGILATILAVTSPQLSSFFHGRRSKEEARRLLALTRFARSEAVSRSEPLELWLDAQEGRYGLRPLLTASSEKVKPREYPLGEGLTLEVDNRRMNTEGQSTILFKPDGTIDEESVEFVRILDSEKNEIRIERAEVGVGYLIR